MTKPGPGKGAIKEGGASGMAGRAVFSRPEDFQAGSPFSLTALILEIHGRKAGIVLRSRKCAVFQVNSLGGSNAICPLRCFFKKKIDFRRSINAMAFWHENGYQ
jgi:hypothetical protein